MHLPQWRTVFVYRRHKTGLAGSCDFGKSNTGYWDLLIKEITTRTQQNKLTKV